VVDIEPDLRFKPATRVENACASGSAAIAAAKNAIEAGEADLALVIGVEKMTSLDTAGVTKVLAMASYWPEEGEIGMTFPGLFAEYAKGSAFVAGKKAIQKAYELANITVEDLDFAEVHDCFTIAEVLAYEAMGLVPEGQGRRAIEEGLVEVGGKLPVNVSGGLKAKGHPVGATGVSMAVLATRQLQGKAIGHQVNGARVGLTYNIGGSAASNYALVLKGTK
jgi:acetyl-CoA acetyltransferase